MALSDRVLFDIEILRNIPQYKNLVQTVNSLKQCGKQGQFVLRSLEIDDYNKKYMELLSQLTVTGDVTQYNFIDQFKRMKSCPDTYYILVIEETSIKQIVATVTLFVEYKFIRNASKRGRIEDMVICDKYRHFGLGKLMVGTMKELAYKLGCYKVTLECKDSLIVFYEKNGFIKESNQNFMSLRF